MKEFDELLEVTDKLLGPGGCPWDQEQTLHSLRHCVVEETYELIEAIDSEDNSHILEELGDFLFNAVFFCKVAEKEERFKMKEVLDVITQKLIRRHPHVFGDAKIKTVDELYVQWEKIKKEEKGKTHRKSALDSIPKKMPALSRAGKALKKMVKSHYPHLPDVSTQKTFQNEEALGQALLRMVAVAQAQDLDAELALRKALASLEKEFRKFEKTK
jgi:tetrapyrrole methylase family protein / MazG family protein